MSIVLQQQVLALLSQLGKQEQLIKDLIERVTVLEKQQKAQKPLGLPTR